MPYFIASFKKKEQEPLITPKETAISSLIGGGVVATGYPGLALKRTSESLLTNTFGKKMTNDELLKLAKKHNVNLEINPKYINEAYAIPIDRKMILGKNTRTRSVFQHELGHLNDKGFKDVIYPAGSFRSTIKSLRDEGVANISAIKARGLKQLPSAIGSYGTYLGKAGLDHKGTLGAGVAGLGLTIAGINHLKNRKKEVRAK